MRNINPNTFKLTVVILLLALCPLSLLAITSKTDSTPAKKPHATAAKTDSTPIKDPLATLQDFEKSPGEARYDEFILKDRMWVYNWQNVSTVIIFIMVLAVVIMGLILSYKQFAFTNEMIRKHHEAVTATPQKASGTKVTTTAAGTEIQQTDNDEQASTTKVQILANDGDFQQPVNTFEVSKDGVKINSAVIGLIILVVSIVFFFLYLQFVYPIHEVPK